MKNKRGIVAVISLGFLGVMTAFFVFAWRDFDYTLQSVVIVVGNSTTADAFLLANQTNIHAHFNGDINFDTVGTHSIPLILQQGRWRSIHTAATLYVITPVDYYIIELGTDEAINPLQFIQDISNVPLELLDLQFINMPPPSYTMAVGHHPITLMLNGTVFYSTVQVVDTTPPRVCTQDIVLAMGNPVDVWDVVTDVYDASPIAEVIIVTQPDYFVPGEHIVPIRATDIFDNYTYSTATVTFLPNTQPPIFYGVRDLYVSLNEPIRFREGVEALDIFGRPIHFDIDNSYVNIQQRGIYPVTLTATDAWGLYTTAVLYVNVLYADPEIVHALADDLLAQILTDDMTQFQKTRTIFNWLQANVGFAAGSVVYYSMYEAAHQGLIHRRGNCAVFAALMELLLTRAEVPNILVRRQGGNHRWVLVNPDDMGWHHVDPTPNLVLTPNARFMMTQSRADQNAQYVHYHFPTGTRHFYTIDFNLLPGIYTVP
ncbi:MAG: transglutaminase-like domain-containing protein [Defluviitaleaceae bacterium]|nr:transglutaminase-like domain-containing protein [Defluviitaleaceae bacterium]